ncbi:hypothetical protein M2G39_21430, partial [Vibrio vulnificus]|nr:hypothetical protein [Vibrio vulnificus]
LYTTNRTQTTNTVHPTSITFKRSHNAALRGDCRLNQLSADHFHHQNSPQTKNATRHESLLNALLCLSFNGLRFTKNKINSTLIYTQKPKTKNQKTEMNHSFDNEARNFGKSGLKFENLKMDF